MEGVGWEGWVERVGLQGVVASHTLQVLVVQGRYVFGIYTTVPSLPRIRVENSQRNATTAPVRRVKMTQTSVP